MLESVNTIDWARVTDAYGPATATPDRLRALTSENAAERKKAFENLSNGIAHQGLVAPAAIPVVPFLVELAASSDVKDRPRLLVLLADVAVMGDHANFIARGYEAAASKEFAKRPTTELVPRGVYEAVAAHYDTFSTLLTDKAAPVRAAASLVLGFLSREAERSAPALRKLVTKEKNDAALASALIALGLCDRMPGGVDEDRATFERHLGGSELVAFAAALALVHTARVPPPTEVIELIVDAIETSTKPVSGFPWNGGDLRGLGAAVLADASSRFGDPKLARAIFDAMKGEDVATELAQRFITEAFGEGPVPEPRTAGEITPAQRALLVELLEIGFTTFVGGIDRALEAVGVFGDPNALRRLLGLSPPGPLDREVEGAPLWQTLRRVQEAMIDEARWVEATAALSPTEILAVCEDAANGAYKLSAPWPRRTDGLAEYSARRLRLLARTIAAHPLPAREVLEYALARLKQRSFCAVAVVAATLLPDGYPSTETRFDPLLRQAFWFDALAPELHGIFASLPLDRRCGLILESDLGFDLPFRVTNDQVTALGAWPHLDLCLEAPGVAEKIVDAIKKWPAGPVPDQLAIDLLARIGASAKPILEAALADPKVVRRDVLERARARMG